ncbi:variable surface protein [Plasmodium gonderi]|uniref:Variable surface protein n=1 Tax=Plasmodium gonderi TaxID=77519 RepID=A0A1Y1JW93_PLAGO|nr:variable surface protein [Plasmodium gonderi]GAW84613.1 variable surface protein [Plasmodium gonderi]
MTPPVLDVELIRRLYPFLRGTWEHYENFDTSAEITVKNQIYDKFCKELKDYIKPYQDKFYDLCFKVVRNLGIFCNDSQVCKSGSNHCNNLNIWLYNYKRKNHIHSNLISYIFKLIKNISTRIGYNNNCPYYSYDTNFFEPLVITVIHIFQTNIDVIVKTLLEHDDSLKCSCREFVHKVVKLYKGMKDKYCSGKWTAYPKIKERTCSYLNEFKIIYNEYLYKKASLNEIIPSLETEQDEVLFICQSSYEKNLSSLVDQILPVPLEEDAELFTIESDDTLIEPQQLEHPNLSLYIIKILPYTLAIFAGISSLLLLSYKFTPIRNLFRSRKRAKTTRNTYNEDLENESFYHMSDNMNIISYNQRYDITYGNL